MQTIQSTLAAHPLLLPSSRASANTCSAGNVNLHHPPCIAFNPLCKCKGKPAPPHQPCHMHCKDKRGCNPQPSMQIQTRAASTANTSSIAANRVRKHRRSAPICPSPAGSLLLSIFSGSFCFQSSPGSLLLQFFLRLLSSFKCASMRLARL
jgi:hypothetical protein